MPVTTSKVKVPAVVIPKGSAFAYETPDMCPKAHGVFLAVAKRGGGKTVACTNLMMMMKFDRIFAISPSMKSNKEMMDMLKVNEEDVFEDPDDLSALDKVKAAIEAERDDLERYWEELRRYKALMALIHSKDHFWHIPDEALGEFFSNGDFVPPKHKWGGKPPMCALLLDDCMGSMLYSKPRRLNQFTIYHRHIGQFEKGGAVGCSMFFLIQSFKSQVGGLTKTIRNQTTCMLFFKSQNDKELDDVAESVSGEVPKETFEKVYELAIQDPHDFLLIDLHKKKQHPSMFRRNFDEFLIVDAAD